MYLRINLWQIEKIKHAPLLDHMLLYIVGAIWAVFPLDEIDVVRDWIYNKVAKVSIVIHYWEFVVKKFKILATNL